MSHFTTKEAFENKKKILIDKTMSVHSKKNVSIILRKIKFYFGLLISYMVKLAFKSY